MTIATVRSAAEWGARQGQLTPQQMAAMSWLDEQLTPAQKQRFTDLWRAAGSPAAPGGQPDWLPLALKLIKEFEGCAKRLPNGTIQAYPDPGTGGDPWTIGWGTTRIHGKAVQPGQIITQAEADSELMGQVGQFQTHLATSIPGWGQLKANQKAALISFAWNCGSGFYGTDGFNTITRTLREKAYANVPAALLLYVNPGTNVEAGLRRRRLAEGAMWEGRG